MRMMCLAVEEGSLLDVAAEQQLEVFELVGQVLVVHRLQLGVRGCAHHRRKPRELRRLLFPARAHLGQLDLAQWRLGLALRRALLLHRG